MNLGPTPTATFTPLPPTSTPIPFVIQVNTLGITREEYDAEILRYKDMLTTQGRTAADDEIRKAVNDELVGQLIFANGAKEAGYTITDAEIQQKYDSISSTLGGAEKLNAWLQANHYDKVGFQLALGRNAAVAWMRDKIAAETSSTAEQVHIQQLLLYDEATAKIYFDQLMNGANFDTLASQIDPVTMGDIGWFPRGYIPDKAVEDAAFNLEVGKTSEIVKGAVGYYILKCIEKDSAHPLNPDALSAKQKQSIDAWLAAQETTQTIIINQ